jgi:hypothetical protein
MFITDGPSRLLRDIRDARRPRSTDEIEQVRVATFLLGIFALTKVAGKPLLSRLRSLRVADQLRATRRLNLP